MSMQEYYDKLGEMDTDVRDCVEKCWDITGRPLTEQPITVALCLLMDSIVTPAEFRVKGRQITDGMKEMTDADFDCLYYTYEQGMLRIKKELEKETA